MPALLKSLELNGYKTFASRTSFEFAGSVTAIVGPNGSGKSNVADALRWVLGEQSYTLLRGRKTDDMIFAGSQSRPRAGMASAEIVFDNSDGWLPIDFSEVSIARRAFRDGQNEYLINNQKVRLKDISELLAKSGLAERTYTVIGQGLVDVALSLKAEERRKLFEEAAGIGLYRSRKDQALRRLDTTKRNLDRVQDILAELKPRLRSLERQSRRAEEFSQIQADLQEILREWYGYHWHRSQRELRAAREVVESQEKQLAATREKQTQLLSELNQTRERMSSLRAQLNSWHRQLAQLHGNRETTSRDLAVSDERKRSLVDRRQVLLQERMRLEEETTTTRTRVEEVRIETERFKNEMTDAEGELAQARQQLQERLDAQRNAEEALENARQRIDNFKGRKIELKLRKDELEKRLGEQEQRRFSADARIEEARQPVLSASDQVHAAREKAAEAAKELELAKQILAEKQQGLEKLEANHKDKTQRVAEQNTALARAEAQLQVYEEAENALAGYASGAKVLLEAARQSRLTGARGALNQHIEVSQEYEAAISAALGEYVDAVVLDDGDPENALRLLDEGAVRGALLPLTRLKPEEPLTVPDDEACLGLAADLVQVPPELRPVADLLLGQSLIVQDRSAAQRILAGQSNGARAVTLRGEVFYSNGTILVNTQRQDNALARPRQQRETTASVEQMRQSVNSAASELEELQSEIKRFHLEVEETLSNHRDVVAQEEEARAVAQELRLELEAAERKLEWEEEQRKALENEAEKAVQELDTVREEQRTVDTQLAQAEEALKTLRANTTMLPMDDHQSQVSYWETQVAVRQQALQNVQARLDERQHALDTNTSRLETNQQRITEIEQQQSDLQSQVMELRGSEGEVGEEINKLTALTEPAEAELLEVETEQERLQGIESQARESLNVAERHYTQAQVALVRQQEALTTLRQRVEDDFGLVEFDYQETISGPTPLPFEGLVQRLPVVTELSPDIEDSLKVKRNQLRRLGSVNPDAQKEYREVKERYEFMSSQVEDLEKAEVDVREVIAELDTLMEREFRKTFDIVAGHFREIFTRLFGGGSARLLLTEPEDMTSTGIDIETQLPGKRSQRLALLSGGERSLTAAALVFSLLKASPTPFCVMDEVDAMLDEANVGRFRDLLSELSEQTQFVVITHNRNTVQVADVIYGITMGRDTASQMISLKLDEVDERYSY
ncbi:MAG: chromosome segregation protein SMC [Chloroflexi bacterium]|nr:MAG: chromosome segregation protein SMC [Chloroflexota bacterium]MBL1193564.1 chromosome segregation protein SMC [Chloroflexota bacterium]NOH10855.1 chromosome segregation protein SMC [Chloroflexota bacterium]